MMSTENTSTQEYVELGPDGVTYRTLNGLIVKDLKSSKYYMVDSYMGNNHFYLVPWGWTGNNIVLDRKGFSVYN